MASLRCNGCERELTPHCKEPTEPSQSRCEWWTCTNAACDHATYDVTRGVLKYRDDHVEQLGA